MMNLLIIMVDTSSLWKCCKSKGHSLPFRLGFVMTVQQISAIESLNGRIT